MRITADKTSFEGQTTHPPPVLVGVRSAVVAALTLSCMAVAWSGPAEASRSVSWEGQGLAADSTVKMLRDVRPGAESSEAGKLELARGRVFFAADDGTHGHEPWVSDGTPAGTVMVDDLQPGRPGSTRPMIFAAAAHGVVFLTDNGDTVPSNKNPIGSMWSTTATGTGGDVGTTTLLKTGPTLLSLDSTAFEGAALLATSDFDTNAQLWRSDGTVAGTTVLRQHLILPYDLTAADGVAYFLDGQNPLWRTDGRSAGTSRVKTYPDNPFGSTLLFDPTAVGSNVFFVVDQFSRYGIELAFSNGTRAGTHLVKDIAPGQANSRPTSLTARGRHLYFVAKDGVHRGQLWRSNGTGRGTVRLTNLSRQPFIRHLTSCPDALYFTATDGHGNELWARYGDPVQTRRIADLKPGLAGSHPQWLTCLRGGGLGFSADDGVHGRELWTIGGPGSSVPVLHDLSPTGSSSPARLVTVGTKMLFTANDGTHGREPWVLAPVS